MTIQVSPYYRVVAVSTLLENGVAMVLTLLVFHPLGEEVVQPFYHIMYDVCVYL